MSATIYYVLTDYRIVEDPLHEEVLTSFRSLEAAENYTKKFKQIIYKKKGRYTFSVAHREKLAAKKLGRLNPNAKGLSDTHKAKISMAMRRQRRGYNHHMWGKHFSAMSRFKISLSKRGQPKRKWALDEQGNERLILAEMTIPPGWIWGRRRGTFGRI